MPKIPAKAISLLVDGKTIEIKTAEKRNFDLNKSLQDPANFVKFTKDPQAYVANYGMKIDKTISAALSQKLSGIATIEAAQRLRPGGEVMTTIWAVAAGAYAVASAKVAVAF